MLHTAPYLRPAERANPVKVSLKEPFPTLVEIKKKTGQVARAISAMVNSNDGDNGVLVGRSINVYQCILMYINVNQCISMYINVY